MSMLCHIIVLFSVQANKASFSFWLSNNITIQSESEIHLRDSILQLSDRSPSLYALVEEASELVRNHRDKFHLNLPMPAERSEEHTSELQSRGHLVCRLLLEKKKQYNIVIENTVTSNE